MKSERKGLTRIQTVKDKALMLLSHAIWHCKFGSELADRPATEGDNQAARILADCYAKVMNTYEFEP